MQPTFWRNGKSSRNAKDFFKGFFLVPGPLSVSSPAIDCFSRCSPFFFDFFPWKKTVVWNALLKRKSRSHLDSLFLSLSRSKIEIRRFVQRSKLASYILCLKINHSSISEPNEETRKNSITAFRISSQRYLAYPIASSRSILPRIPSSRDIILANPRAFHFTSVSSTVFTSKNS